MVSRVRTTMPKRKNNGPKGRSGSPLQVYIPEEMRGRLNEYIDSQPFQPSITQVVVKAIDDFLINAGLPKEEKRDSK